MQLYTPVFCCTSDTGISKLILYLHSTSSIRCFSWSPPPVTQQNRLITSYTLSCSPSPSSLPQSPSQTRPLTVAGFSPDTSYSCSVVANSGLGSGPPAHTNFTTLRDCESYSMINGAEVYGMCVDILYRFIFPNTSWWSGCLL